MAPRVGVSASRKYAIIGMFLATNGSNSQLNSVEIAVRLRQEANLGSSPNENKKHRFCGAWRPEVVPFFIHFSTCQALFKETFAHKILTFKLIKMLNFEIMVNI